jgi:acetyl esterase/lipase
MTATQTSDSAVYTQAGSSDLSLDVFPPTADSRRCAVLVFHGGGWRVGGKEDVHERAAALAAEGFTAIAVQYRLLDAAPWPAPLDDATAALAWVRANAARLDIDPNHIVVQGHSAGAHIALMTGTLSADERPAAIVAYYPPIGFHSVAPPPPPADPATPPQIDLDELGRVPSWMLLPPGAGQAEIDAASPMALVDADFPPTLIVHATADQLLDPRSSVALHQRLVELGVPSELHIYAGRDHEFDVAPSTKAVTVPTTAYFIERTVTHRDASDAEARRYSFPPDPEA